MKLSLILILVSTLSIFAGESYAQKKKLTLKIENAKVEEVLSDIERQSEFYFFVYSEKVVDVDRKVSVDLKEKNIETVLNTLFAETEVIYSIEDRLIVLSTPEVTGIKEVKSAQQRAVSGLVSDSGGLPLPGVSVVIKGTTRGTVSNTDGEFTLPNVPAGSTLVFSFVGMRVEEVVVGDQTRIDVKMAEETIGIEEVVAIAYGSVKKKDLTGSISTVSAELIEKQSNSTVTRMLEGAVAGVQVSAVDGQPGYDMGIRVRGVGSANLNSSGALVVIDGVPAQTNNPLSTLNSSDIASITVLKDAASTALYGSRGANGVVLVTTKKGDQGKTKISFSSRIGVNSVGPYKLGKIDNAKDYYEFAWRSIYNSYRYGVDGTGKPQDWTTNVNNPNYSHEEAAEFASQHLFNYINSETAFGRNKLGNYMAYNVPGAVFTPDGTGTKASATMTGAYLVNPDGRLNPAASLLYSDNYSNELLENAFRKEYNVAANGGNEKVDYFLSAGYLQDPSYIRNSSFDRYSGRAKLNAKLYDWLKVGTNVAYTRTSTDLMTTTWGRNPGSNPGNVFRYINGTSPIVPVYAYNEDGSYRTQDDGTIYNAYEGSTYSPLGTTGATYASTPIIYAMDKDTYREKMDVLNTRSYMEVSFLKDFKFTFNFSLDKEDFNQTKYLSSVASYYGRAYHGGMYKNMYDRMIINTQSILGYNKDVDKHHFDAIAVHEYNDWHEEAIRWGSSYELIPGFMSVANFVGKYVNVRGLGTPYYSEDIERMESYLGRANYIFDEKYYLSASVRADGSSKFKKDRWGTFWSVGTGWRITSEPFMEGTKNWLDNLKLRASYGVIGNANAIGRYSGYRTWGYGAKYTTTSAGTGTPASYTLSPGGMVNDALTWENTNTFDCGIDFSLFNRVYGTFDFYNRVTDNTFYNQPVSYMAVGQESLQSNSATLQNKGIEIELGTDIIRNRDFVWNVSLNGTHFTTVLIDVPAGSIPEKTEGLPDNTYEANGEGWSTTGSGNAASGAYYLRGEGRDWYNLWIYKYAGVDQETGLPLYYHRVTDEDVTAGTYSGAKAGDDVKVKNYNQASKYEVGSAIPKWIGGLTTSLKYKDFDLSTVLAYQLGGKFYSVEYGNGLYRSSFSLSYSPGAIAEDLIGNTWTPENKDAKYPMQWYDADNYDGATFGSWKYTDLSLFSASYLRVKNITLGYNIPKRLLSRIGIGNLRVYASGDNLFMISAAKGIDPSMSLTGGMEVGAYTYPTMRTISFGINLDL
ncbi:TonB-linked outer membrane protein, SusC/RagA family [Mariniphaga anaerophila]|uniref:TonB-linked outer membrane protein, SusC/RagA family n=1 Tax=Mariniphaga anaerophila TaxID=1484053 RepID=A0A1M5G1H3_9BACT|nr:TonB-dependent receptor [Mariniphaga anaerophila]SHF97563.1 TonB-linked outer membrane protein, SusC/RagA family [Mariniphaga anaerophila]